MLVLQWWKKKRDSQIFAHHTSIADEVDVNFSEISKLKVPGTLL